MDLRDRLYGWLGYLMIAAVAALLVGSVVFVGYSNRAPDGYVRVEPVDTVHDHSSHDHGD